MSLQKSTKTVEIRYDGELRTTAVHGRSGNELITDAPTDNHGKGETFSPTDLLATALLSCMVTVMGIQANKRRINPGIVSGSIEKIMIDAPRRVGGLHVELAFKNHSLSKADKIMLENAALNCPVALSIHPDIQMNTKFVYA